MRWSHLHYILSPWPFAKWGMSILGPFSPGKGQVKFLIVAADYFTKWIEAKPLTTITAQQVHQFVWKDIICRYGVPHTIITHNGQQFIDKELAKFSTGQGIKHITSSVEHPQTNGHAKAANKVILVELRKRLDSAKGRWPEELVEVLWAYRCTPQSSTNESPFSLVYGVDAMIPVKIGEPSLRRELYGPTHNHQNKATHLDLLPELREKAQICKLAAKKKSCQKVQRKPMSKIVHKRKLSLENGQQCKKEGWQVLRQLGRPIPNT